MSSTCLLQSFRQHVTNNPQPAYWGWLWSHTMNIIYQILIKSSFYPQFILILSLCYPHFLNKSSFYPHFLIKSSFYPRFFLISSSNPHFILILSSFKPHFIFISSSNPHQILILSSFLCPPLPLKQRLWRVRHDYTVQRANPLA